jgi:hypothetical protein
VLVHVPPLLFWQKMVNPVILVDVSVLRWPGSPRMIRFVLCEVAVDPEQLNITFMFAPNGFAVIVPLPLVTLSPVAVIPHVPLHA